MNPGLAFLALLDVAALANKLAHIPLRPSSSSIDMPSKIGSKSLSGVKIAMITNGNASYWNEAKAGWNAAMKWLGGKGATGEFTEPTWTKVVVLLWGTILARERRIVTAALRSMGCDHDTDFSSYH